MACLDDNFSLQIKKINYKKIWRNLIMYRNLQNFFNKNANAMFFASEDSVRGRLVTADYESGTFSNAATPTDDLYVLDKEQIPSGVNVVFNYVSDYDAQFEDVKQGEYGILIKHVAGERFSTDQFVAGVYAEGDYLTCASGADAGKFTKAAADTKTKFKYAGTVTENGHELIKVQVV